MRACQVLFCVDVSVEHSVDSAGDQDVEGSVHWGALQGALVMVKGIIGERSCRIMRFVRSQEHEQTRSDLLYVPVHLM